MPRLVWLALISLTLYACLVNFQKFLARPSLPQGFREARTQEAQTLANNMAQEPANKQNIDRSSYVWLLLESAQRKESHDAAAALLPQRPTATSYDRAYAARLHRLAISELMHDCAPDMLVTLQHRCDYDSKHLSADDATIYRDYNNLGLACFLVGQSNQDEQSRYGLLLQADGWLQKAEAGLSGKGEKSDLVSVKENELMLAEAMKDPDRANRCRREIDALLTQINGPAPRVTL